MWVGWCVFWGGDRLRVLEFLVVEFLAYCPSSQKQSKVSTTKLHGVTSRKAVISLATVRHPRDYLVCDRSRYSQYSACAISLRPGVTITFFPAWFIGLCDGTSLILCGSLLKTSLSGFHITDASNFLRRFEDCS